MLEKLKSKLSLSQWLHLKTTAILLLGIAVSLMAFQFPLLGLLLPLYVIYCIIFMVVKSSTL